jgi:nicotinic acid phosphoribosyltransferase
MLDNDFYKFTMQQGVVRLFPGAKARYQFIRRALPRLYKKLLTGWLY